MDIRAGGEGPALESFFSRIMGCAQSEYSESQGDAHHRAMMGDGLRLVSSKLHFKPEQLDKLNDYFRHLARSDCEDNARLGEAAVERLVQRLMGGLANLDRRFASTFLVSLNEPRRIKQRRFEYLLRIDALSTPGGGTADGLPLAVEEDGSLPGFARLKLRAGDAGDWAEFIGPDGRLRRDLVKARIAALLAAALRQDAINGADERLCTTPGQVVDAEILDKILKQPEHYRIFFGPANSESNLPDVSDHRVAIVEDESGIILKIGLYGSRSQDIEVRLLIGASIKAWPSHADYPKRIPLYHCDALLHYNAAQTGMYVVAIAPHQGLRCDDRATLWRIRFPAAETMMRYHYSDESVPAMVESALFHIVDQLRGRRPIDFSVKRKGTLRLVSRQILRATHWWSLERTGPDPLRQWAPDTLARHVLRALDELLRALKCQNLRCYFQPRCNLMLQCARGGTQPHDEAYTSDGRLLESYLSCLHAYSTEWLDKPPRPPRDLSSGEILERELVGRWWKVMASVPRGTMDNPESYGPRQLQYLGLVVSEVLRAKDSLLQETLDGCHSFLNLSMEYSQASEPIEKLIYLMCLVLKQAKEQVSVMSLGRNNRRKRIRNRAERKRSCAKAYFDRSADMLIDIVRKDRDTAYLDLENDTIMAKTLLRWLHFGMAEDKKVLAPLLGQYLCSLFAATREYGWQAEGWQKRRDICNTEMRSLGLFCKLVSAREILPANGIVESLSKGWAWAENIARMIERSDNGLKLIFLTPQRILRYQLKFADDKGPGSFSTWSKARNIGNAVRRASIARTSMITATDTLPGLSRESSMADAAANKGVAGHVELRDGSPLTLVAAMARRRGRQRGPGGLIPALVTLNKFRVLQEVAHHLPRDECTAMLELVQRVSRETARRLRRASCPDPSTQPPGTPRQLYTPRSESKLYEPPIQDSPKSQEQKIIMERQLQLEQEILEIHDTMTRGLRSRNQLPAWDSTSMTSWGSSVGSIGRGRFKRHNTTIWDAVRGSSPLWDSVSCSSTFSKMRTEEVAKKDRSLKYRSSVKSSTVTNNNEKEEDFEDHKLPSWDLLEKALNKKLLTYEYVKCDSFEENKDASVDYVLISNDTKEVTRM